jgi:hypothetical protein
MAPHDVDTMDPSAGTGRVITGTAAEGTVDRQRRTVWTVLSGGLGGILGLAPHAQLDEHRHRGDQSEDTEEHSPTGDQGVVGLPGFVSGEKRRRRRLLLTTNTELKAMAAPAMRGLSRPSAASGMAAML